MGDVVPFPQRPERPDDWPWCTLRDIIEDQVKRSAPEVDQAVVSRRLKPGILRMVELGQEISLGIRSEEVRDRLVLLVAEQLVDRLLAEVEVERMRA